MFCTLGKKLKSRYIVVALQFLILGMALLSYLLNRSHPYEKDFHWEELVLAEDVTVQEGLTVGAFSSEEDSSTFASSQPLALKKGTYRIQMDYHTDSEGGKLRASIGDLAAVDWNSTPAVLSPDAESAYVTLELAHSTEHAVIKISYSGSDTFTVNNLSIHETSAHYKKNLFYAVLLCAAIALGSYFYHCDRQKRQVLLALAGIFLISCYPLFKDYLIGGDDIPFHLLRIEGIAAGLSQGIFPVKIHPVWAHDYGYATGIFYGDFALYFPALLRLLGFSIQTAYTYFVAFIQLGTVLISYAVFQRIFRSDRLGLLGSLLYSLSLYRLMDVYTRASVGEFTAMMFFPIVFCGFYMIFTESDRTSWWKHGLLTALGLTGLIQSHILSCEMTVFFVLITCLLLLPLVKRTYRFLALSSGAILTLLMNLGFLVPFLSYFNENIMIHSSDWVGSTDGSIQDTGLFPLQLFSVFQKSSGGTWKTTEGILNEAGFSMGIVFLVGMFIFIYLLLCHRHECQCSRHFLPACFCFVLGCFGLWMCTCYFPWDVLANAHPLLNKLIVSVEFPWRFLAPTTVLLTFVCCFAFSQLYVSLRDYSTAILTGGILLLLLNTSWYFYDLCSTAEPYRVYDTYELNTMAMYSNDYLPAGTNPDLIREGLVLSNHASISEYNKYGTKILCRITAEDKDSWVDFPLNYYEDYRCTAPESGEELPVSPGTNNMVRISLPEGFSGALEVSFHEPLLWRVGELISFFTLLGCGIAYGVCIFKEKSLRSKEKLGL